MRTFTPRQKVEQYRIDSEASARMWGLPGLAEECGTEFSPVFPIFIILLEGKVVAYYYATPQVVVRPTVHPDAMTPRQFYEVAKVAIAVSKRSFARPLWLVDTKSGLADPELLGKLGLTYKDLKVFEVS